MVHQQIRSDTLDMGIFLYSDSQLLRSRFGRIESKSTSIYDCVEKSSKYVSFGRPTLLLQTLAHEAKPAVTQQFMGLRNRLPFLSIVLSNEKRNQISVVVHVFTG